MGTTSIVEICTTIKEWMDELKDTVIANGFHQVQNYDEITEAINDPPTCQVYWEDVNFDATGATTMYTLKKTRRAYQFTFHIDAFCQRRNNIDENMGNTHRFADLILNKLEEKDTCGAFGQAQIQLTDTVEMRRVVFQYGTVLFPGVQVVLPVEVI